MSLDLKAFKEKLLIQKSALEASIHQASEAAKPVELDQTATGRVSRIDAIQQQEMILASQRRRAGQIQKIEAALCRIETGDFGLCVKCGEDIAEKRLVLDPAIPVCVDCAQGA